MSRPTPPIYKTRNWPAYNQALKRRGSLTNWFDPAMTWKAAPTGKRGRQADYSDAAIQTCLTMKVLFGMALRQTTGFVESLLRLIGLDWAVPDFSTLSRRQKTLKVNIPYRGSAGPLHLLVDSTGIKVEGEGEWNARKHGGTKRRVWRKIHIGIDEKSLEIRAAEFTTSDVGDAPMLPELLDQIPPDQEIASVTADGAAYYPRIARLLAEHDVAGDALVGAGGIQAVGAGQVDQLDRPPVGQRHAPRMALHGHARIIAHLLARAGERVEQGALAGIGIADQRDQRRGGGHSAATGSNAGAADFMVVYAKTDPQAGARGVSAFVLEPKATEGIGIAPAERTMGLRGGHVFGVTFDDCFVPEENRIGAEGTGFRTAMKVLDNGRIEVAAQATGIAEAMRNQAGVIVTVPFLTLTGDANHPGYLDGHGTISADHARNITTRPDTHLHHLTGLNHDPTTNTHADAADTATDDAESEAEVED